MSESADIIRDIMARHGYNYADFGRVLGINRSTPRQVAIGRKQGANLRDALAELREQLDAGRPPTITTPPPKRTTKAGTTARVRRSATVSHQAASGTEWSVTEARRQASRAGGSGIGRRALAAAQKGQSMAVTASFNTTVSVRSYGATRGIAEGHGGSFDMPIDPAEWLEAHSQGTSFSDFVIMKSAEEGLITGNPGTAVAGLESLELRTW